MWSCGTFIRSKNAELIRAFFAGGRNRQHDGRNPEVYSGGQQDSGNIGL